MDLGSLFLILALFILVGLFVSRPFFDRREKYFVAPVNPIEHERSHLLAERDRVINSLYELDFDYALDKIPEQDYPIQRENLLKQGAQILRQLDGLEASAQTNDGVEDRIEAAIAARRTGVQSSGSGKANFPSQADDEIEVMIANRRRERQEKSAGFCPQCGGPIRKSDRFCPKCGANLI